MYLPTYPTNRIGHVTPDEIVEKTVWFFQTNDEGLLNRQGEKATCLIPNPDPTSENLILTIPLIFTPEVMQNREIPRFDTRDQAFDWLTQKGFYHRVTNIAKAKIVGHTVKVVVRRHTNYDSTQLTKVPNRCKSTLRHHHQRGLFKTTSPQEFNALKHLTTFRRHTHIQRMIRQEQQASRRANGVLA